MADQRKKNFKNLERELSTLLRNSLKKQSEYTLQCEARFGKVVLRARGIDLRRDLCVEDVSSLRNREFYVRYVIYYYHL